MIKYFLHIFKNKKYWYAISKFEKLMGDTIFKFLSIHQIS